MTRWNAIYRYYYYREFEVLNSGSNKIFDDHIMYHYMKYLWAKTLLDSNTEQTIAAWKRYLEYRNRLIIKYHDLIFGFMRRFCISKIAYEEEDFYDEAILSLYKCVERFDIKMNRKFSTFFYRSLSFMRGNFVRNKSRRLSTCPLNDTDQRGIKDNREHKHERYVELYRMLRRLTPVQRTLLEEYYGLKADSIKLQELGIREEVTKEAIRQRVDRALRTVRELEGINVTKNKKVIKDDERNEQYARITA
jgi:RNA polymerase sigma factor (sigma-70 family)